ncbi:MAG: hypothetical protein E7164_02860 [Firmicutes bacterium]|nr:hypothetical protein [Bacillota bacterium]
MKVVGVFTRIDQLNGKKIIYVPIDIINKLKDKVKIKFLCNFSKNNIENLLDEVQRCDGIIIPGGDNIINEELEVCKFAYDHDIPILGICLGMQTMAMAYNGIMGTIPNFEHKSNRQYVHKVSILSDSKLYRILRKPTIMVNSRHKDYIIKTDLKIGAKSPEGIIEAIECPEKRFFIGVQWHPENLKDRFSKQLFDYFISML